MAKITGTVIWIRPVVANGNTAFVFTLMKQKREYLEWDDEVFDAVFVAAPTNRKPGLVAGMGSDTNEVSDLAVQMACVEKGAKITVEIGDNVKVPVKKRVTSKTRVEVKGVEILKASEDSDDDFDTDFEEGDDDQADGEQLLSRRPRRGLPR
jgi:hypothetical protein